MIKEDISNIGRYSQVKITAVCDNCSKEKKTTMKLYTSYGYKDGDYLCRSCKLKKNNQKKYGVDNVFQLDKVKEKSRETINSKYGVDYISQSKEIQNKIKSNNIKKYGVEHHLKNNNVLDKQKKTNLNKYGVDNISKLDSVKDKKRKTTHNNYGVDYIFMDEDFKKNLIKYNKLKYGVEHMLSSDEVRSKIKETNKLKYGHENPSKNRDISSKIKKSVIKTKHRKILENKEIISIDSDNRIFEMVCDTCESIYNITWFLFYKRRETNTEICTKCNPIDKHQSGKESKVYNFINKIYKGNIIRNHIINNKELDIFLPDLNIAFEINGLYWHSEIFKPRNYHKDKTNMCIEQGIDLVHLWEDDIDYKFDLIKYFIVHKLGLNDSKISARQCSIMEVKDNNIIKDFLNKNHLQGSTNSSVKLGLYFDNELVSLMTFKKNKDHYDLNRFCNKRNKIVRGGASKLLKYFISNYSDKIFTFSDNSYSSGKLYEKIGFEKDYEIKPDYKYVDNGIRIHKFNYRNKDTSNLFKIYDCGKIKYKLIT